MGGKKNKWTNQLICCWEKVCKGARYSSHVCFLFVCLQPCRTTPATSLPTGTESLWIPTSLSNWRTGEMSRRVAVMAEADRSVLTYWFQFRHNADTVQLELRESVSSKPWVRIKRTWCTVYMTDQWRHAAGYRSTHNAYFDHDVTPGLSISIITVSMNRVKLWMVVDLFAVS